MRTNHVENRIKPRILLILCFAVFSIVLAGCSVAVHEKVYPIANAKARLASPVDITPGTEGEYTFTVENTPAVTLTCALSDAKAYYSFDGVTYQEYSGPITLPIADYTAGQTFTVSAYADHPDFNRSETVTRTYRFMPTQVPTPTIDAIISPDYHYNAPPTVTLNCALSGATLWYSIDGGANWVQATGPFTVPVPPDWTVNRTIELVAYAKAPRYIDSRPVSRSFSFYINGAIVTIAGTGTAGDPVEGEAAWTQAITSPYAVFVDDEKNVYFTGNECVWKINGSSYHLTRLAGSPGITGFVNGAVDARTPCLSNPMGLSGDNANDRLYIASTWSHQILSLPYEGETITRVIGNPDGTSGNAADLTYLPDAGINRPTGIQYSAENSTLYYSETQRYVVRTIYSGTLRTVAGTLDIQSPSDSHLQWNRGICVEAGKIVIADNGYSRFRAVTPPDPAIDDLILGKMQPWQIRKTGSDFYYLYGDVGGKIIERYNESTLITTTVAGSLAPTATADGSLATEVALSGSEDFFIVPGDGIYIPEPTAHRIRKVILY